MAAGAEVAAFLVARVRLGVGYGTMAGAKQEILDLAPRAAPAQRAGAPDGDGDGAVAEAEAEAARLNSPRELHPFFGYSRRRDAGIPMINNQGFLSDVDFPYRPRERELVVGVFGGSVALDLAHRGPREAVQIAIGRAVASRGYDDVKVLVLAQGAWRQPQQLFCFLYYMDMVDVALFLEGYNEISELPLTDDDRARSYPWSFPAPQVYEGLLVKATTAEELLVEQQVAELRERELGATRAASRPVLRRSMVVHVVWNAYVASLERRIATLQAMLPRAQQEFRGLYPDDATLPGMADAFFERYGSWVEAAYRAGAARGKPVFHFLQPNQYVPGSKPFSEHEKSRALARAAALGPRVARYFPRLQSMSRELHSRGVPSFDLSRVFAEVTETMYRDSCCHLNGKGMTLVAEEMARIAASSPLLQMVPSPAERRLPFGPRASDLPDPPGGEAPSTP